MARKAITPRRDTADALTVLGQQIKRARLARGWTVVDTAQRLGISATTYAGIEAGAPTTAIGTVFNAAAILRVPLFSTDDPVEVARMRRAGERDMGLINRRARAVAPGAGRIDGYPA